MSPITLERPKDSPVERTGLEAPIPRNGNGLCLRSLRQQMGLSQRALARKVGIPKSQLQRLEGKSGDQLCLGEVRLLSKALGITMEEFIQRVSESEKNDGLLSRFCLGSPLSTLTFTEGVQLASYLQNPRIGFIGTLTLEPRKSLARDQLPQMDFLFLIVFEGNLLVTLFGKEYVLKKWQGFSLERHLQFELYNPHQFEKLLALIFTIPPILQTPS